MKIQDVKNNTPFDIENKSERDPVLTAKHVKPARFMTTRASVFMGLTILSLSFAIACDNNYITSLLMLLICTAFYSVSIRFIRFSKPILNSIFFLICPLICWGVYFADIILLHYIPEKMREIFYMSPVFPLCFIPMAAGLAALSVITPDGKDERERPSFWNEVMMPALFAALAASFGSVLAGIPERRTVFAATLMSVLFLIGFSALITVITKAPMFFTSKRLTEYWDIPVADVSELRRFFFARLEYIVSLFVTAAILYLVFMFLGAMMAPYMMPIAILSAVILGTVMVAVSRPGDVNSIFGTKFFLFELITGSAFVCVHFAKCVEAEPLIPIIGLFLFFACAGDFFVSGLISVIRRRQIFVEKNKYTDGLPFMMIMLSLLIMAAEAMFPLV